MYYVQGCSLESGRHGAHLMRMTLHRLCNTPCQFALEKLRGGEHTSIYSHKTLEMLGSRLPTQTWRNTNGMADGWEENITGDLKICLIPLRRISRSIACSRRLFRPTRICFETRNASALPGHVAERPWERDPITPMRQGGTSDTCRLTAERSSSERAFRLAFGSED